MNERSAECTPLLRWAGSKRAALPILAAFAPQEIGRYLEPFAGSACLFFRLAPPIAIISDLNLDLIDCYKTLRAKTSEVHFALIKLPFGREHYYQIRGLDPFLLDDVGRAARFIYLNRFCFNGLYRTCRNGRFNVPYGAPRSSDLPALSHLQSCAKLLETAELVSEDFEAVITKNVQKGDFIYLDPPYFQTEGRVFRQYTSKPFLRSDLDRLASLLLYIDEKGAKFLLSYAENAEAAELFDKWRIHKIEVQRNISGFSGKRGKSREIIATNY